MPKQHVSFRTKNEFVKGARCTLMLTLSNFSDNIGRQQQRQNAGQQQNLGKHLRHRFEVLGAL